MSTATGRCLAVGRAAPPEGDEPEGRAVDVATKVSGGLQRDPVAVGRGLDRLGQLGRNRGQQRKRHVGRGVCEDVGRVADRDATAGGGVEVDVVVADRDLREHAAVGHPLDRLGVYLGLVSVGAAGLAIGAGRLADALGAVPALLGAAGVMTAASVLMTLSGRAEPVVGLAALLLGATQAANPVVASAVERIIPPARAAQGYATYQVAFALGFGAGGTVAGFLYEADPLLPFIATAALALPVAAIVAAVLSRTIGPVERVTELS